jgi:hypothetical protein
MIRDALAGAIMSAPCSLARTGVEGRGVAVSGLVGRSSESAIRNRARESLPSGASSDSLNWRLDVFDGPYCGILDTIRSVSSQPVSLTLRNGATKLRKDDDIVPVVTMPDGPSWLVVDYFSSDGGVTHLHPTTASPPKQDGARSVVTLGNTPKERWQVDAPFGTVLVLAVVASSPLFTTPRPADESVQAYLQALRSALEDAQRKGTKVSANAILVQTTER